MSAIYVGFGRCDNLAHQDRRRGLLVPSLSELETVSREDRRSLVIDADNASDFSVEAVVHWRRFFDRTVVWGRLTRSQAAALKREGVIVIRRGRTRTHRRVASQRKAVPSARTRASRASQTVAHSE